MQTTVTRRYVFSILVGALVLLAPSWLAAQTSFGQIVVFGTSLSDPGNAYALTGQLSVPPYATLDPLLIPSAPYAKGGHHFSNGATWVEQFSRPLGLAGSTRPAFQGDGQATNYAVGGARARHDGINFDLSMEVAVFLGPRQDVAPSDALYVIEIGGNDLFDAAKAFSPNTNDSSLIIQAALQAVADNLQLLYSAGARKFLVWNAPDISLTPATHVFDQIHPGAAQVAESLTVSYNTSLDALLGSMGGLPGIDIKELNAFGILRDVVADPAAFGLSVVNSACVMPNTPPFQCHVPDDYLFWDGIHPTAAAHAILAQDDASLLAVK